MIDIYYVNKALKTKYGEQCEFWFVIGEDLVPILKHFAEPVKMFEEMQFVIHRRTGYKENLTEANPDMPKKFKVIENCDAIFSSTEVRA